MAANRTSRKPACRWTFGAVAIILALGLLWLALDGGRSRTQESAQGSATLSLTKASPDSERLIPQAWELGLSPSSRAAGPKAEPTAGSSDNLTVLALGGAGALALTGLALFLAWKLCLNSPPVSWGKKHRLSGMVHRASSL